MAVPAQSPLASEVLSGTTQQDFAESDLTVRCPKSGTPVTMDNAHVVLNDNGSSYYCSELGCDQQVLLGVEQVEGGWQLMTPHGLELTVKPA